MSTADLDTLQPALQDRVIVAPRNQRALEINNRIVARLPGVPRTYLAVDTIDDPQLASQYPPELLHKFTPSGLPPYELILKLGAIVMLLRNMDVKRGLCNGTRCRVVNLGSHFILLRVCTGPAAGQLYCLPRIMLESTEGDGLPVIIRRLQYPIRLAHCMTINKSQGQTLDWVGIDLTEPVFSHGQLHTGVSRGRRMDRIRVRLPPGETRTRNVVYKEVLQGLLPLDDPMEE